MSTESLSQYFDENFLIFLKKLRDKLTILYRREQNSQTENQRCRSHLLQDKKNTHIASYQ